MKVKQEESEQSTVLRHKRNNQSVSQQLPMADLEIRDDTSSQGSSEDSDRPRPKAVYDEYLELVRNAQQSGEGKRQTRGGKTF